MNANLTNLITSAAAVLAMTSSAFAQYSKQGQMKDNGRPCTPFEQGMPLTNCENFPAAYNQSARPEVRCSWDVFATATFLYWYVGQEGMDVGYNTAYNADGLLPPSNGLKVAQKGEYKPGFKVGVGANFDFDKWVGYVEYTWLHASTSQNTNAGADTRGTPVIVLGTWYRQNTPKPLDSTATALSSKWTVNLDMLDATLSRPYYEGRNLTITPFSGARALWLRQNFRLSATAYNSSAVNPVISHNNSNSWGLGPRMGMLGHWQLGYGFRVEGDASASILYQSYTKVSHREDALLSAPAFAAEINGESSLRYKNYGALRPIADMGMGIGWGSYLDCQNYYLDIAANYDFMILWGQNMLCHLVDEYYSVGGAPAELYYHGLTLTARFDF
jgi:hypothetical protein